MIELIVSTALLGILGVGMLTALSSTIIVSNADRGFAGTETVLRTYASALESRPYKPCTAGAAATSAPNWAPYTAADLAYSSSATAGYTTSVTSLKFLSNKNDPDITADSKFSSTCPNGPAPNPVGDQGVQKFVLRAVRNNGTAGQNLTFYLRRGDG